MPLTVITLQKVVPSLRGDLSKWMQEIATGVYIGNFNSKVREELWKRVVENVGAGEATLVYAYRNEIGYQIETINANRKIINFDGVPLVQIPMEVTEISEKVQTGFSQASKNRRARKAQHRAIRKDSIVVFDLETTGLNEKIDSIIEIAAVKLNNKETKSFHCLIKIDKKLPTSIIELTGITDNMLAKNGVSLDSAINDFKTFIHDTILVGYNISFDLNFLNHYLRNKGLPVLNNRTIDIMSIIKKENMFLENYKLKTVIASYDIMEEVTHRASEDVLIYLKLMSKLNKFSNYKIENVDLEGIF